MNIIRCRPTVAANYMHILAVLSKCIALGSLFGLYGAQQRDLVHWSSRLYSITGKCPAMSTECSNQVVIIAVN